MTEQFARTDAHDVILDAIETVAPDVDARSLSGRADMRLEADLDSIDFIAVLTTVRDRTGIEVPEADYRRCHTIDGFVDYLVERSRGTAAPT